jgi:hypothetical protein
MPQSSLRQWGVHVPDEVLKEREAYLAARSEQDDCSKLLGDPVVGRSALAQRTRAMEEAEAAERERVRRMRERTSIAILTHAIRRRHDAAAA